MFALKAWSSSIMVTGCEEMTMFRHLFYARNAIRRHLASFGWQKRVGVGWISINFQHNRKNTQRLKKNGNCKIKNVYSRRPLYGGLFCRSWACFCIERFLNLNL